ncbi:MAG: hypothetical protein P8Y97_23775, partial [Candidatus Lokiarchaeota archaeon]
TFDKATYWQVNYEGKIINSANEPVLIKNLDLYLEINDRISKITTISTDQNGQFNYSHNRYHSFEESALASLKYVGDEKYNPFHEIEYAGLESFYDDTRIIPDLDDDGLPDWIFDSRLSSSVSPTFKFEVGKVTIPKESTIDYDNYATINFKYSYNQPVIIPYIYSREGDQSIQARVKDVHPSGCTIFMEENDNEGHEAEKISYIVMEAGVWYLQGVKIEAGIVQTDSCHGDGLSFGGIQVDFVHNYTSSPVVLHALNSYNNGEYKSSLVHSINSTSFKIQQAAGKVITSTSIETIGFISIEANKTIDLGSVYFETGLEKDGVNDGVDDTYHEIEYSLSYDQEPVVIVSQNSALDIEDIVYSIPNFPITLQNMWMILLLT